MQTMLDKKEAISKLAKVIKESADFSKIVEDLFSNLGQVDRNAREYEEYLKEMPFQHGNWFSESICEFDQEFLSRELLKGFPFDVAVGPVNSGKSSLDGFVSNDYFIFAVASLIPKSIRDTFAAQHSDGFYYTQRLSVTNTFFRKFCVLQHRATKMALGIPGVLLNPVFFGVLNDLPRRAIQTSNIKGVFPLSIQVYERGNERSPAYVMPHEYIAYACDIYLQLKRKGLKFLTTYRK